jgi:hypothetical protein
MVILKETYAVILIVFFSLVCGCRIVSSENEKFNIRYKYNLSLTKRDNRISTKGFYNITINKGSSKQYYLNFILFPDGICNWGFLQYDSIITRDWINQIPENSEMPANLGIWGIYELKNDKLLMKVKLPPHGMAHHNIYLEFTLNSDSTKLIWNTFENSIDVGKNYLSNISTSEVIFCELDRVPNSDCWLKTKRWFWADKEAYKSYKKERSKKQNK